MEYKHSIDLVRFIAACGIVWYHVGSPGSNIEYCWLLVFMIFSIALMMNGSTDHFILAKFKRFMIPWIFWSFVYGFTKIAKAAIVKKPLFYKFYPWMLFTGVSLHLWFLPFAFLIMILLFIIKKNINLNTDKNYIWALISGLSLVIVSYVYGSTIGIVPLTQWAFIFPAVPVGIYFSSIRHNSIKMLIFDNHIWILMLFIALLAVLQWSGVYVYYIVAILVCAFAWLYDMKESKVISYLGGLSFGIYLIHELFISAFRLAGIPGKSNLLLILTLLSSIIGVMIMRAFHLEKYYII